jgi:MFS family permease
MGIIIPGCMLVYGWSVQQEVGGIALPVAAMFLQGVAQLFCFPALNVYAIEVLPERSADSVAGNYMFRYFLGAAGSALVLPAIEAIGVGWFSTLSAAMLVVATGLVYLTVLYGKSWRERFGPKALTKSGA